MYFGPKADPLHGLGQNQTDSRLESLSEGLGFRVYRALKPKGTFKAVGFGL